MDFAWVVDALRRGLKVTREAWKQDPPVKYIYMFTGENGKRAIMMSVLSGPDSDFEWYPTAEQLLTVTDWEEYVEPKEAAPAKSTQEDLPVWPEVNADGYARMSKDSDKIIHDGVYRPPKKEPVFGDTPILKFIRETTGSSGVPGGQTVEDQQMHGDESVCESWPAVTKVWTTYWDLDIQITGALIDKADYPYTLCERDVIEQKRDKLVVLAEPGFSQRTVTLHLNENCWMDAKDASASLIHRLTNRFGWNTEFFISLLNGIEHTDGDWCKPCSEGDNRSLGDLFTEDMEFLAQEQARVAHSFYYIINQYLRLVQTTAPERQRRDILARCEDSMRRHRIVLAELSKKNANQEKED